MRSTGTIFLRINTVRNRGSFPTGGRQGALRVDFCLEQVVRCAFASSKKKGQNKEYVWWSMERAKGSHNGLWLVKKMVYTQREKHMPDQVHN